MKEVASAKARADAVLQRLVDGKSRKQVASEVRVKVAMMQAEARQKQEAEEREAEKARQRLAPKVR